MLKVSEYRQHAAECLAMAQRIADPEHKKQLIDMANTWSMLANDREAQLAKQAKMDQDINNPAKHER